MNQRKFQRNKMKSVMAKVKEQWKSHCKAEREKGNTPMSFEEWVGVQEGKKSGKSK